MIHGKSAAGRLCTGIMALPGRWAVISAISFGGRQLLILRDDTRELPAICFPFFPNLPALPNRINRLSMEKLWLKSIK